MQLKLLSRRARIASGAALVVALAASAPAWAIKVLCYNLLNYPVEASNRDPSFRTVLDYLQPDVIIVQELQGGGAANAFLINVLNQVNPGAWAQDVYYNCGDTDQLLYYRIASISTAGVGADRSTTINTTPRLSPRWKIRLKDYNLPENSFYVYGCHLKAGQSTTPPSDATQRANAAAAIRADANNFPTGTKFIIAGDMNMYTSAEQAYLNFTGSTADNDGRVADVLNPSLVTQSWSSNSTYRFMHSQSPRNSNPPWSDGGVLGGLDDRFDFLFISTALNVTSGLSYVTGTYRTVGQDGTRCCNGAVNNPLPNGDVPNDVANALWAAADHLPVLLQLRAPPNARVSPATIDFGSVLVNSGSTQLLTVTNIAPPPGETLTYSYTSSPPGTFIAPGGTLSRGAGVSAPDSISMNTSFAGAKNLTPALVISTNSLETPSIEIAATGTVLNHAVPSVDPNTQVTAGAIDFGTHPVGEFDLEVGEIYNIGYTPGGYQARAEVYLFDVTGPNADRFIVFDVSPPLIDNFPSFVYVFFDDAGATPGLYSATFTAYVADELSLPGASELPQITFDLTAGIPGLKGDFNLNGVVDCSDVAPMISVLLNPAGATAQQREIADMNGDTLNDGRDIQPFVNVLVCP